MPWCPQCDGEYREGFDSCADCGVTLVDTPPAPPAKKELSFEAIASWALNWPPQTPAFEDEPVLAATVSEIEADLYISVLTADGALLIIAAKDELEDLPLELRCFLDELGISTNSLARATGLFHRWKCEEGAQ